MPREARPDKHCAALGWFIGGCSEMWFGEPDSLSSYSDDRNVTFGFFSIV